MADEKPTLNAASDRPPLTESPLMPSLSSTPSTSSNSYSPQTPISPSKRAFQIEEEASPTPFSRSDSGSSDRRMESFATTPDNSKPSTSFSSLTEELEKHDYHYAEAIADEIKSANWTIGEDGRYLETTSAHAARDIKRLYDQRLRVGQDGIRSPYAILVTQDEQGRTVYRVSESNHGRPETTVVAEPALPSSDNKTKSRIRMSVGGFLAGKSGKTGGHVAPLVTNTHQPLPPRKPSTKLVRSVRSNSDLRSRPGNSNTRSRQHSDRAAKDDSRLLDRLGTDGDAFNVLLGWSEEQTASSRSSTRSESFSYSHDDHTRILHPFGEGTAYTAPSRPLDLSIRRPASPPQIRYMQSFESGLTARAEAPDRHYDRVAATTRIPSDTHATGSPYFTDVFDVLQTYRGIPLADTLSAVATETTFRLSSSTSVAPKDDPRFVIWGHVLPGADSDDFGASQTDLSSVSSSAAPSAEITRRGSASVGSSTSQASGGPVASAHSGIGGGSLGSKVIVAATIERWIAQLTSELNYVELLDFFLTYRVYIRAIDLCHLLICRFHWAVKTSSDGKHGVQNDTDTVKKIVRVRTFIAFRYWLSTFFQVDFLKNPELCKLLTSWLNSLKTDNDLVGHNADVLDIVRKLKKVVRECKEKWYRDIKSSTTSSIASGGSERREDRANDEANMDADVDLDLDNAPSLSSKGFSNSDLAPSMALRSSAAEESFSVATPRPSDVSTISPPLGNPNVSRVGISQLHDLQATILLQPNPTTHLKVATLPVPTVLPMHQSTFSRVLVNTMGKLGRWKRVMHTKSSAPTAACGDASAFDPDGNSDSDREAAAITYGQGSPSARGAAFRGGLDAYLRASTAGSRRIAGGSGSTEQTVVSTAPLEEHAEVTAPKKNDAPGLKAAPSEPPRRLLRTASAIPLNSRLEVVPDVSTESQLSPPGLDAPVVKETPAPEIPTVKVAAPYEHASQPDTDVNDEPLSPPGLDIPAHLLGSPKRPASALSMRRVGDPGPTHVKSDGPPAQKDAVEQSQTEVARELRRDVTPSASGEELHTVRESPKAWRAPVQQVAIADMDAHTGAVDDSDSESLAQEMEYHPEIVALDDFDLSSSDSESEREERPGRLRRPQRRLPTRRDFEFVRRSVDTVSSLGVQSSDAHSSVASSASRTSTGPSAPIQRGEILPWHLDLIEDSEDDEPQDVDAALARLEGQIDATTQREKLKKVDRWMSMVASRIASGGGLGNYAALLEEEEAAAGVVEDVSASSTASSSRGTVDTEDTPGFDTDTSGASRDNDIVKDHDGPEAEEDGPPEEGFGAVLDTPRETQPSVHIEHPEVNPEDRSTLDVDQIHQQRQAMSATTPTPPPDKDGGPTISPVTPTRNTVTTLVGSDRDAPASVSKMSSADSAAATRTSIATKRRAQNPTSLMRKAAALTNTLEYGKPNMGSMVSVHRSFVLLHRSETLAQHLAMIEREMFLTVKFGEIVSSSWAAHSNSGEVLDWSAYVKERAKTKVEAKTRGQDPNISDIDAMRARFNIMVAFTASEVLLTHPDERSIVFSKFVRIAWKCYLHNNFATVVGLITGLQSPAVSTVMKRVKSRVGIWETRVFEDLQKFTSPRDNFRFVQKAIDTCTKAQPPKASDAQQATNVSGSGAPVRGKAPDPRAAAPAGCIPFIGIYLCNLERYRRLPDYIDPTAPTSPVVIDHETGSLSAPLHPEVFSTLASLPPSVHLEPLINVQKQRLTAGVVKSIVAGQHLATKVSFDLDRKLYQKCLRLKALAPDTLMEIARTYAHEM